jgi:AmpD protein
MYILSGYLQGSKFLKSLHFNKRPQYEISLLVIHNISLPPNEFNTPYIERFFTGQKLEGHEFFEKINHLKVSSHLLIKRNGQIIQFVNFLDRAWHAGISSFNNRENCNDFSIGIELEGTDHLPFTDNQYESLITVTKLLLKNYPLITKERIVGHSDIAPGRKTDPGVFFDWNRYLSNI